MASKFGGVAVDEQVPSGSKFGGVAVDEKLESKIPTGGENYVPLKGELAGEPKFLEKAAMYASAVPAGGLVAGGLKAASAGTRFAPYAGQLAEALIPKSLSALTKATASAGAVGAGAEGARALAERKGASPQTQQLVEMGTGLGLGGTGYLASKVPGAIKTITGAPYKAAVGELQTSAQKLAESLMQQERGAGRELYGKQRQAKLGAAGEREAATAEIETTKKQLGTPQDKSVTGKNLVNEIKDESDFGHEQRKLLAESTYGKAWNNTRKKQQAGDYWQSSPSGQDFFNTLENKIKVSDVTPVTTAEETEIKNIINELQGKQTGFETQLKFDPATGLMENVAVAKKAPLDIKAVTEVLRKLRDAEKGFPEEGFKAIAQRRLKAMSKSLEKSIADWDDSIRIADQEYKTNSEKLYPERTRRGESVLARQKYDINELSADPANAPAQFFQSKQGVQDLTRLLGNNKTKVADFANQYVVNELSALNSSAKAEDWVTSQKNIDWMNEVPGLRQKAEGYVKQLLSSESKSASAGNLEKTLKTAGRQTAQTMSKRIKDLKNEAFVLENADPEKVGDLARTFAAKLEKEQIASPAQLQKLESQIKEVERLYKGKERAKRIAYVVGSFIGLGYTARETSRIFQGS